MVLQQRAAALARQLAVGSEPEHNIDTGELAVAALRTLSLPEISSSRESLVSEVPVYGRIQAEADRLVSGRADAVLFLGGRAQIVFDWKSDVAPDRATRAGYANQLALYVRTLDAERGAIVYMTSGQIQWDHTPT